MLRYLKAIVERATHMFLTVAAIMAPVMLLVYAGERLGLVALAGQGLAPVMGLLGLPAEAGIIWATTVLTGMYGGIAIIAALAADLHLSVAQMTALGAMMLFAHNMPTEQAVVRAAGASALITGGLRLILGATYGAAVAWVCWLGGWLQDPVSFAWLAGSAQGDAGAPLAFLPWLLSTARALLLMWLIINVLVIILDALDRLGVTRFLTRALAPVLRLSGLTPEAAPLVTTGMLIGLTYGGALIIDASTREGYSRRTLLLSLCWLSLFHSVLEDTLLIFALGANIWVILVLRGLFTLAVMATIAMLTRPGTRWGQRLVGQPAR